MSSELQPNLVALNTIVYREVRRFTRIWPQTLLPPAITMVLYFVIFGNLIGKQIGGNEVVLFMKGTKAMPQCGFSMQVAQILNQLGVAFKDINVLEDMGVRDGIKAYSNWPTIPQLYVKGELQELLTQKGIAHNAQTLTA